MIGPVVLTDLELAVLEGAHRRTLGEEPGSGTPGEEDRGGEVTAEVGAEWEARRSLVARGLLRPDGELPEEDDLALVVGTLLDLRVAATQVLLVERFALDEGHAHHGTRLVHVVGGGACVEDVLPDGSHRLHLVLDVEQVVPCVSEVTVPPDATSGTGPSVVVHPGRPEDIPVALGHPTVLVELAVLAPGDEALDAVGAHAVHGDAAPAHHLLALGPSGCWVTDIEPGRSLPESVVFRPVPPGWVGEWVRSVLEGGGGRRSSGGGDEQGTMSG